MIVSKETVFSTTVGVALGAVIAVISATLFVGSKLAELEKVKNELSSVSKKVAYLECEVRRQNHAFDFVFTDLQKMLYGIRSDPQDIENMMGPVLKQRRETFDNEKCDS